MKVQLIVCAATLMILSVVCAKGSVHDFKIFKESRLEINDDTETCVDLGYQGIQKKLKKAILPHKRPKNRCLTKAEKKENRQQAQKRVFIEHVNRRCKIFRIVKETFRGKHKNFGKIWNLIAGLVNFRYSDPTTII